MSEKVYPEFEPRNALLCTQSWAGRSEQECRVIGETPKKYRILNLGPHPLKVGGRRRFLPAGWQMLVPKRAVKFKDTARQESKP